MDFTPQIKAHRARLNALKSADDEDFIARAAAVQNASGALVECMRREYAKQTVDRELARIASNGAEE